MICMEVDGMKRVLFKVILPLAFIVVWLNMCYWICLGENGVNWFQFWIMSGFPFGIQKMLVLLIPRNFGIAGSIGVLALDAVIGGMIGVIVLAIKIIAIIAAIAVVIVAKVVRDTKNAKKQKENIPADTFNDFYEEELNWWDKDLKEGEK